jgi:thiol:disulfide interchange protein DsbD
LTAVRILWTFLFLLGGLAAAFAQAQPLDPEEAFQPAVSRLADEQLRIEWTIAPGYYLYRDQIAVTGPASDAPLSVETQNGVVKDDPTFGRTEILVDRAESVVSGPAAAAASGARLTVTYQGCQDGGICYRPITKTLDVASLGFVSAEERSPAPLSGQWRNSSNAPETAGSTGIALADDAGLVSSLRDKGGVALVLGGFLLFGLALAFTPCVLPMYPILGGLLARSGENLPPARGFVLSSVYVLSMASAFGLLGIAAAWSGQNLQMALQAPAMVLAVSLLFFVLALSMFGLFTLQLPAGWVAAVERAGGGRRGSLTSAALLGFTSALIVGPCVTAPLAGALLYVTQTGDAVLGAGALFALGIGKGIPLVAFGTVGPKALPKAGPWMERVKKGFGLVFLGAAVWMVSRIIPGPYGLALWALLLIGSGVFLGAFDVIRPGAAGTRRAGKAAGLAAFVYGVLLAVGAAGGSSDPFRPLGALAPQAPTAQGLSFAMAVGEEQLAERIAAAQGRPSLVYFTADWCVTCAIIERSVLPDEEVKARLAGFNLVKVDVSGNGEAEQEVMRLLEVAGPPTMIFIDANGREVSGSRLVGDLGIDTLLASAGKAQRL